MATTIAPNDILAVRVWTKLDNQAAVNTFNYQCFAVSGVSVTDVDLASFLVTQMTAFYASLCCNQTTYRGMQVYFLRRSGPLPLPANNTAGAGACTGGVNGLPRNTALILKYGGFNRGPSGRGRLYLPFLPTDIMGPDGEPNAGALVLVNSFASAMLTPIVVGSGGNTASLTWQLVKRKPPIVTQQIVTAECAEKFGQMHKRGDYGRPNNPPF